MPDIKPITIYRFWQKVVKTAQPGSCWVWCGANARGYGKFKIDNDVYQAHVISWMIHIGPIPEGMKCLHNCPNGDNRLCCNPAHLWIGSQLENMKDMANKGRANKGVTKKYMTDDEIEEAKTMRMAGVSYKMIQAKMGFTEITLWRAVNGKNRVKVSK